jgi:hypothetical protein
MGGKARQAFQVVLWGAAMFASGGAWGAVAGYALAGTSTVYGAWAAREERKKAEASALNGKFADRKLTLRGGNIAKSYVYGQAYVSGVLVGGRSPKSKEDPYFWMVLALPVAHKITGFSQVMYGEHTNLWPFSPNGDVASGWFNRAFSETHSQTGVIPSNGLIDLKPKPGHTGEPIYVLGPLEGEQIVASVAQQENVTMPVMTTGDDTWQDRRYTPRDVTVRRVPGIGTAFNPTLIELIGGVPGEAYSITYKYQYTKSYIKAWAYLGDENQLADPNFIAGTANAGLFEQQWTASDRLRGIPYVVFRIHPDPSVFPEGLEPISFRILGKEVFTPRDVVTTFSTNPALATRDYLINEFQADPGEIDDTGHFISQINICDEPIPLTPGVPNQLHGYSDANPHQERYRIDLALSTENTPLDNLGAILTTCDGAVVPSGPYLDIWVGHFPQPEILLQDSDFVSYPEVIKGMSRPELYNSIRVRHPNDQKPWWPMDDAHPYPSRFYALQDNAGQEPPRYIWREADLLGTRDSYMAHRISKQMLWRARNGLRLIGILNTRAIPLAPELTFYYQVRSLGMANPNKIFRVKRWQLMANGTVEMEAQEDHPFIYEWDFNETNVDITPNTSLPNVRDVPKLVNLRAQTNLAAAAFGPNGELTAQCRVMWDEIKDAMVLAGGHVDVRYKRISESEWNYSPKLPPTQEEFRFPVRRNDILVIEGRANNRLVEGPWTMIKKVADDTPTQYLTGNLLVNARFHYRNQFVTPTTIDFIYDGWNGPFNAGNIEMMPYRQIVGPTTARDPNNNGVVYWFENDLVAPTVVFEESTKVSVTPGDNMVAYVYGHSFYSDLRVDVVWFDATGAELFHPNGISARWSSPLLPRNALLFQPLSVKDLQPFGGFFRVPDAARTAIFTLVSFRDTSIPTNRQLTPVFFQPYLGRASAGQVVFPPWNA